MSRAYDNAADGRYQQGGRRNLIINGAMEVAQRATSKTGVTANDYQTLDRYRLTASGATYSTSQQSLTVGQTDIPSQFKYFQRFNPTTADNNCGVAHRIEDVTTVSGETVTFSLYAKGTNPAGGELDIRLSQNFGSGGSTAVNTTVGTLTLTSSWQRFTYTVSVPSISGKTVGTDSYLELKIFQPDDDTGTSAFTFDSTGWQLELGNIATPFEHRSFGEELALCQRYYWRAGWPSAHDGQPNIGLGFYLNNTRVDLVMDLPVTMRSTPSIVANSGTNYWNAYTNGDDLFNGWSGVNAPTNNAFIIYTTSGVSGSAGNACLVGEKENVTSLAADAEL